MASDQESPASSERVVQPMVIHVVESYGGGVASAVHQYIRSVPNAAHVVLVSRRHGTVIDMPSDISPNTFIVEWSRNHWARFHQIRTLSKKYPRAIFHAHSSLAGLYLRTAIHKRSHRIVYTPHAYSFERRDISTFKTWGFTLVEFLLARNTTAIAACSEREAAIAKRLNWRNIVVHVPNIADTMWSTGSTSHLERAKRSSRGICLVGVGRLSAQKDPFFFAEAVRALREAGLLRQAVWVGGGEANGSGYESVLRDAGVDVTGWLSQQDVIRHVASADLYLHSALWEGFPLAVLDAVSVGIPTVVRHIPCFAQLPTTLKISTPQELCQFVVSGSLDELSEKNLKSWQNYLSSHTPEEQTRKLALAYDISY